MKLFFPINIPSFAVRAFRFGLTGLFVTLVHVCVAVTCIEQFLLVPPVANGIAFILATLVSYVINTFWSFSTPFHRKNLCRFFVVAALGLLLTMSTSGIVEWYGASYWYGILAVIVVVSPTMFLLHNFWTYS